MGAAIAILSTFAFVAAQGGAVFLTALVLSRITGKNDWLHKLCWMGLSFWLWIAFTYAVFFSGADVYIIFFGVTASCAVSSALFLGAWLLGPVVIKAKNARSRGARREGRSYPRLRIFALPRSRSSRFRPARRIG